MQDEVTGDGQRKAVELLLYCLVQVREGRTKDRWSLTQV